MKKPIIRRVPAESITGRRFKSAKGSQLSDDSKIPQSIKDWNAAAEEKKRNKESLQGS